MAHIAFLGLGAMGSRMAANLLKAGHAVTVWNRSPAAAQALADAGAQTAATARHAAEGAEFVISMVRDDEASRVVWLDETTGALGGMSKGAVAIESSTLSIDWVRELADKMAAADIAFLDAPVAGSRPQAEAAQLIYLVGGKSETFERAAPVLKAMGGAVHHAGKTGDGAVLKLVVNALLAIQGSAIAELIGTLKAAGLEASRALEIIGATPVASPAMKGAAASMLAHNFAPMFPVELIEKDLGYVQKLAEAGGVSAPLIRAARDVMQCAMAAGMSADNFTGVVRLYEKN